MNSKITSKINKELTLEYMCNHTENQNFDRKSSTISEQDLANHIAGMANADGGVLVIGISDDGKIIGFNNCPQKLNSFRKSIQYLNTEPEIKYEEIDVTNYKGENDKILLIHIYISLTQLIRNQKDEVYLRRGDSTIKLTDEQIQILKIDRPEVSFEEQLSNRATIECVDEDVLKIYKEKIGATNKTDEEVLMARGFMRKSFITGEKCLTNAGVLLFAKDPSLFLQTARIRVIKIDGTELIPGKDINIIKDETFTLPLYKAIKEVPKFIHTQIKDSTHLTDDGVFETIPEYPEFTYVEGVTNAVTHRNYVMGGEYIKIFIYSDRMEIRSPGKLAGLVTLNNIKYVRYSRNRTISRTLTEFGVVRELNEGVSRIYKEMEENSLAEPEIKVDQGDIFVLTLKNSNYNNKVSSKVSNKVSNKLSKNQEKILKLISENAHISRNELSNKINISETSVYKSIKELKSQGYIERIGSRKNGYWKILK